MFASQFTADKETLKYALVILGTTLKVYWKTETAVLKSTNKNNATQARGYVFNTKGGGIFAGVISTTVLLGIKVVSTGAALVDICYSISLLLFCYDD